MIRKPIVTVVGHVDHGKTSLLDAIRQSTVTEREAGKITQAIGASIIPIETLKRVCGDLLKSMNLKIPGLLFIDTPGHAAFSTLRKRGGALADIAILVVDINEGFMPQTEEAIEILKASKTPFLIAANKLDLVHGWQDKPGSLMQQITAQTPQCTQHLETKMYELIGTLYEKFEINAERFDRVQDYTKQIAIVPMSALKKNGLPEILMVLVGLVQKYLEKNLECDETSEAKATILEVKEQKGLGKVLDVILYDGCLKPGDPIAIGGIDKPIITKIRGIFEPSAHSEMMDTKGKYSSTKEVVAATGVRIIAPGIESAIAGMPIATFRNQEESVAVEEVQSQIDEVVQETDKEGVVIKADTIGGLEALSTLLKEKEIPVRKTSLGEINKNDIADAESNYEKDPTKSVILAFNVGGEPSTDKVQVISSPIIYQVIEQYELWIEQMRKKEEEEELSKIIVPCKVEILEGYTFRQSNPAVVGVSVEFGTLRTQMPMMREDGKEVTFVKGIQHEQKNITQAEKGKQVAVSFDGVTVGRQINEKMILYSSVPEADFIKLKKFKHLLKREDIEILKIIATIKREDNPVWGI